MSRVKHILDRDQPERQVKDVDLQWMQQSTYPLLLVILWLLVSAVMIPGDILEGNQLNQNMKLKFRDANRSQEIHTFFLS
jgi:hypothetical protein